MFATVMSFSVHFWCFVVSCVSVFFFFKQKTAYEMRISDWSSDVCSSDLDRPAERKVAEALAGVGVELHKEVGEIPGGHFRVMPDRLLLCHRGAEEIGRASCRERVCQYV